MAEELVREQHGMGLLEYAKQRIEEQASFAQIGREVDLSRQEMERWLLNQGWTIRRRLEPIHPRVLEEA